MARATARRARRRARSAPRALLVDDRHRRRRRAPGRPRRARAAACVVAGLVAAVGLDRVVEPQHRGRGAAVQDAPAGVEPVGERSRSRRRRAARAAGAGCSAQPGAGDDAERALGADEQLGEVGPDRGPRARRRCGSTRAVGEHDVEADDDVLDLAVAGASSWPAPRQASQPPTVDSVIDCGQCPTVSAVLGAQLVLEDVAERAGQHVDDQRRRRRRRRCRSRPVQVEHDAAVAPGRSRRTRRCARPAAVTGTRGLVADARAPRRPRRRSAGRATAAASAGDLAVERPDHRQRPPVAAGLAARRPSSIVTDGARAGEPRDHAVGHLDPAGAEAGGRRRPPPASAIGGVGPRPRSGGRQVAGRRRASGPGDRQRVERGLGQAGGRRAPRSTRRAVGLDLTLAARRRPSRARRRSARRRRGRRPPTRRGPAGGPGCGGRARRRRCGPSRSGPRSTASARR